MAELVSFSNQTDKGYLYQLMSDELVNAATTIYSRELGIEKYSRFAVAYKATSVIGAPDVTITFEQSIDLDDSNFVAPATVSAVHTNLTAETMQVKEILPIALPFIRFVVLGNIANPADTLISLWIYGIE